MSPEEQLIAIAEECGYTTVQPIGNHFYAFKDGGGKRVPDYLNDLNACHEMEEMLIKRGLTRDYYDELVAVTTVDRFYLVHATASQRAEAFLRTIGKWPPAPRVAASDSGGNGEE